MPHDEQEVVQDPSAKPTSGAGKLVRALLIVFVTCGLAAGAAIGMKRMESKVIQGQAGPTPQAVGVTLAPTPDWMPQSLGKHIARSLLDPNAKYNDPNLANDVYARAGAHPWIRRVELVTKRVSDQDPRIGLVLVNAEFRQPAAMVKLADGKVAFVDREGYRLDENEIPSYMRLVSDEASRPSRMECFMNRREAPRGARRIHYLQIDGVLAPPPAVGQRWIDLAVKTPKDKVPPIAADLADGLTLVEIMSSRPYVGQIKSVDVRNHGGRISKAEPFLRLTAQVNNGAVTDIRFGRLPIAGGDYEVSTERKLQNLDNYVADHDGSLVGKNRYINLQYDKLHVSFD